MARERRGTAEETAAVPGQRAEPTTDADHDPDHDDASHDTGRTDTGHDDAGQPGARQAGEAREGTGPPAGPVAPTAKNSPLSPDATAPDATAAPRDHKIRHTRLSGTWAAVVGFAVVLLLLLIFILQNQHTVEVSYFGAHGHLPLGVSLLLSAVAGILLVALAGSARIMQLRATARKHRRADAKSRR